MKLLCFDLDNTLIRSTPAHIKAFEKAFTQNSLPKKKRKEIIQSFSVESSKLVRKLYPSLDAKQVKKVVDDHDLILIQETAKYAKPIPSAKQTLKLLKKEYELALLSNCKRKEILCLLHHTKINKSFFKVIIGNDNVKHPKPAPDEIIKAEQLLKLNDGYMVGDSVYDIRAGRKAKVKTISVLTGDHSKAQLQKEKPWKIIKSVKDLPKLLKQESKKI